MKYIDYYKTYHNIDSLIMVLLEKQFAPEEIATICEITLPTVYNAKKRQSELVVALESLAAPVNEYGSVEVNKICNAFKQYFGTTATTKSDRFAANRLDNKYGVDSIVNLIKALAKLRGEKFAPSVNSVYELDKKLVSVIDFIKKTSTDTEVVEI